MKQIDYNSLRKTTVFDICGDPVILKKITAGMTKEEALVNYRERPVNQAFDLLDYADLTGDKPLREAILKEWEAEINLFFNE